MPNEWRPPATPLAELSSARTRLASAQSAVSEKKLILANQFADESRAEAELASAKTAEAKASAVNERDEARYRLAGQKK